MSNLDDDDDVKRFFNKVAKNYNINYDESDWQKMEKMLDAENARAASVRSARWKIAALSIGVLSLLLMTYFFVGPSYTSSPASKEVTPKESTQADDLKNNKANNNQTKTDGVANTDTGSLTLSQKQNDVSIERDALAGNAKNHSGKLSSRKLISKKAEVPPLKESLPLQKDTSLFKIADPEREEAFADTKLSETRESQESIDADSKYSERNSVLDSSSIIRGDENKNIVTVDSSANDDIQKNELPLTLDTAVRSAVATSDVVKDSTEIVEEITDAKSIEEHPVDKETKKEDIEPTYSRWSVTLAIAPDFSSTEIFKQASAGSAIGITIQYGVSKRWSLQTGALLTSKKYWNKGDEYSNIRPGYWVARTNGVIPERIDGGCSVLEIPLALRYTILNINKDRIHASAGMSSYVMLSEFYDFSFKDPNPSATQKFESSETQNYILSIGSVSIAYERMIYPKLFIGIEPYAKIPFAKMGWAKLPLYSMGAYLTLRYRMLK